MEAEVVATSPHRRLRGPRPLRPGTPHRVVVVTTSSRRTDHQLARGVRGDRRVSWGVVPGGVGGGVVPGDVEVCGPRGCRGGRGAARRGGVVPGGVGGLWSPEVSREGGVEGRGCRGEGVSSPAVQQVRFRHRGPSTTITVFTLTKEKKGSHIKSSTEELRHGLCTERPFPGKTRETQVNGGRSRAGEEGGSVGRGTWLPWSGPKWVCANWEDATGSFQSGETAEVLSRRHRLGAPQTRRRGRRDWKNGGRNLGSRDV